MKGIDFSNLSLKDALDLAILIEEEARERYAEFVDQMEIHHTPEAASFFRLMVENESKHEAELANRRRELFGDEPRAMKRTMLWDIEAPDYDQARAFMPVRRAMEVALESEMKAHQFFARALQVVVDPAVRTLFEELCREELVHQDLVRKAIEKALPDSDIDPDAYADEPVGL